MADVNFVLHPATLVVSVGRDARAAQQELQTIERQQVRRGKKERASSQLKNRIT